MGCQWAIWLLVTAATFIAGDADVGPCDSKITWEYYEHLHEYEAVNFPFYGKDEAELTDTCGDINDTIHYIKDYINTCNGTAECDKDCQSAIYALTAHLKTSGLADFADEICDDKNPKRSEYLRHYGCLKTNEDVYAVCYNDSMKSRAYLEKLHVSVRSGKVRPEFYTKKLCCFFSWYPTCYLNVTYERCGDEAGYFIEEAFHQLNLNTIGPVCDATTITCDAPPLPGAEDESATVETNMHEVTTSKIEVTTSNSSSTLNQAPATSVIAFVSVVLFKILL